MVDISVIIPSYNTKEITLRCLNILLDNLSVSSLSYEVIVVDNASKDGSQQQISKLKSQNSNLKTIFNKKNIGFGAANNQAAKTAAGKFILFLNSDVLVKGVDFSELVSYLEQNTDVGVLTVELIRPSGKRDLACHRGFPTLWRSLCYFTKLEQLFGNFPFLNRIFGGYHLTYLDKDIIQEIDSPSGAFYLVQSSLFKEVNGFDKEFFMYGEDLDLSFRIKEKGKKIVFYPKFKALHLKYQSGLQKNDSETRTLMKKYFYDAMKIFYQKHYADHYPDFFNSVVYFLIDLKT